MIPPRPGADANGSAHRRRLLQLVQELRALSRGTDSPAEAANAAAKAQALLLKHNLTVAEAESEPWEKDPLVEEKREFQGGLRRVPVWRQMLVVAVARASLCEWMTSFYREPGARTFSFIGRRANVEVACYSYTCLERQVVELGERARRRRRHAGQSVRGYLSPYLEGAVDTIARRLEGDRRLFQEQSPESRAIVRARDHEAYAFRSRLYPGVRFSRVTHYAEVTAHEAGRRAGQGVRLHTALGSDGRAQRLLDGPTAVTDAAGSLRAR